MEQEVTVYVNSTKYKAVSDSQIYHVELNESNQYRNSFSGTMIHIQDSKAYVVNSTGKIIIVNLDMVVVTVA